MLSHFSSSSTLDKLMFILRTPFGNNMQYGKLHFIYYHDGFLRTMRRLRQVDIISLVNLLTAEAFESIGWFRYQYTVMVFVRISVIFSSLSI